VFYSKKGENDMKIGYIGGFWATNIGNSFYNLGALYLLKEVYGEDNVYFIPDPPQWMWKVDNNYDFISNINLDMVFISGPCLNYSISRVYKRIFDNFKKNNIKIAFISTGASEYTQEESIFVKNFLSEYQIEFIMTRDEETYNLYKDSKFKTFNGLCTSMFLNDAVKVIPVNNNKQYIVFNFAKFQEPIITKENDKYILTKKSIFSGFQKTLDNLKVIRTNNSMFCRLKYILFDRDNIYYSDLPYGYISILKHSNLVFSDRVHTCACTLIMGGKAMYIKGSKRSHDGRNNLFKRIKVDSIYEEPTSLDFDYINQEKEKMKTYLMKKREDI
jgi:hypothetical protein